MITIAIAGTSKNAGKTTAMNKMLEIIEKEQMCYAVLSSGYDGEKTDTITRKKKPLIHISPSNYVVTERRRLNDLLDVEAILEKGIRQDGDIVLAKASGLTAVEIIGTNTVSKIEKPLSVIKEDFKKIGICMIDGAFDRIIPSSIADHVVLSVSAVKTQDPDALTNEVEYIRKAFSYPVSLDKASIYRWYKDSLVEIQHEGIMEISGAITKSIYKDICISGVRKLIFQTPIHYIASNLGEDSSKTIIEYRRKPNLLAVTVSPYYVTGKRGYIEEGMIDISKILIRYKNENVMDVCSADGYEKLRDLIKAIL